MTLDGDPTAVPTNPLGAYLQARRGLVTPEQVGLPAGGVRK